MSCFFQWNLNKSDIYLPLLKRGVALIAHEAKFSQAKFVFSPQIKRTPGAPSGYVRGTKNKTFVVENN